MIDTKGMITVAEAAKRLDRSIEQVRRKLREGKLKGQRIGNQWFVDLVALESAKGSGKDRPSRAQVLIARRSRRKAAAKAQAGESRPKPLIPPGLMAEVDELRRRIAERNPGYVWDAVEMVRRSREEDLP